MGGRVKETKQQVFKGEGRESKKKKGVSRNKRRAHPVEGDTNNPVDLRGGGRGRVAPLP